jgi:hypothetical protein
MVACLVAFGPACQARRPRSEAFPRLWVVQGSWLNQIASDEPAIARALFRPPSVVLGARPGRRIAMKSFMWPSYRWFSDMVLAQGTYKHSGAMAFMHAFTSVVYDPEDWRATPLRERQNLATYFHRFGVLGHSYGWRVIITPHPDLTMVPHAPCAARTGESEIDAFLRCDLIGAAARYADVVEVQAQGLEGDTAASRSFVEGAAAQARLANPQVQVIAGLTTGSRNTAAQMYAAWNSVRDSVDGYYLSISGNARVATALSFLHMLPIPNVTPPVHPS